MSFDTLLNFERLESKVSLNEQETCVLHNLDLVDSLFDELLAEEFILLIDIYYKDVAFFIGGIQLLLLIVPAQARKHGLVRIAQLVMCCSFPLSGFEPFEGLIVADREYEVLLHNEEDLDHSNSVDQILLQLQPEKTVFLFSPSL